MSWAGDVMTRRLKSMWGATGASFCHSAKLCVCVSVTIYLLSVLFTVVCHVTSPATSPNIQFVRWSDWEWSMQGRLSRGPTAHIMSGFHCVWYAHGGENSFWGGSFHQRSSQYLPRFRWGGAVVAVLMGIADGSDGGNEDGRAPIFFLSHQIQRLLSEIGSPPCGSSPRRKGSTVCLSFSEEGDREDVDEFSQNVCLHKHVVNKYKTK